MQNDVLVELRREGDQRVEQVTVRAADLDDMSLEALRLHAGVEGGEAADLRVRGGAAADASAPSPLPPLLLRTDADLRDALRDAQRRARGVPILRLGVSSPSGLLPPPPALARKRSVEALGDLAHRVRQETSEVCRRPAADLSMSASDSSALAGIAAALEAEARKLSEICAASASVASLAPAAPTGPSPDASFAATVACLRRGATVGAVCAAADEARLGELAAVELAAPTAAAAVLWFRRLEDARAAHGRVLPSLGPEAVVLFEAEGAPRAGEAPPSEKKFGGGGGHEAKEEAPPPLAGVVTEGEEDLDELALRAEELERSPEAAAALDSLEEMGFLPRSFNACLYSLNGRSLARTVESLRRFHRMH